MKPPGRQPELFSVQAKYVDWRKYPPEYHKRLEKLFRPKRTDKNSVPRWKERVCAYRVRVNFDLHKNGRLEISDSTGTDLLFEMPVTKSDFLNFKRLSSAQKEPHIRFGPFRPFLFSLEVINE